MRTAAALVLALTASCRLIAGTADFRDREPGVGGDGSGASSAGGTATGQAGGMGGAGGASGGGGSGGSSVHGCPNPVAPSFPDSSMYCYLGLAQCAQEDGGIVDPPASLTDMGNGVVVDNVTGLSWEQNAQAGAANFSDASAYCGSLGTGGLTWRVPNLHEQLSIADYAITPVTPPAFDQAAAPISAFWTVAQGVTGWHWSIGMDGGRVCEAVNDSLAVGSTVRCVSGSAYEPQLSREGDSACDARTGLEWHTVVSVPMSWPDALSYCFDLSDGGGGWRVPTIKELMTIAAIEEPLRLDPAFEQQPVGKYWSSTPSSQDPEAWRVNFNPDCTGGNADLFAKPEPITQNFRARCVRFQQP